MIEIDSKWQHEDGEVCSIYSTIVHSYTGNSKKIQENTPVVQYKDQQGKIHVYTEEDFLNNFKPYKDELKEIETSSAYDFNDFEFTEVEDNHFIYTNGTYEKEATEPQDKAEQSNRQTGDKPLQYQIDIDTFERSKANQMAETRVEIAKFMIDKYNWRNKRQDIEDFLKIKDYCDFAIEALNEIVGV